MLEKRYLHQNGAKFQHKLIGNQVRDGARQNKNIPDKTNVRLAFGLIGVGQ